MEEAGIFMIHTDSGCVIHSLQIIVSFHLGTVGVRLTDMDLDVTSGVIGFHTICISRQLKLLCATAAAAESFRQRKYQEEGVRRTI